MAALTLTHEGRVARLTLDRPPLNVIDLDYARRLTSELGAFTWEPAIAALVVEAKGRAFCAGVDVRDHLPDRGAPMLAEFHRVCGLLLECPVPVVAAVHGAALGGGCELTLVCDLVVASSDASFGQPEIKLGVFPPLASVALPRIAPFHVASEMLLLGTALTAGEARDAGLVNRVAEPGHFPEALEAMLAELLALSPASLRLAKRALALGKPRPSRAEIGEAERFYVDHLMHTPDSIEGLRAFMEKRAPEWTRE